MGKEEKEETKKKGKKQKEKREKGNENRIENGNGINKERESVCGGGG